MNTSNAYVKSPSGQVYSIQANGALEIVTGGAIKSKLQPAPFSDAMQARMSNLSHASANHTFW